jgi:hypothetical protein
MGHHYSPYLPPLFSYFFLNIYTYLVCPPTPEFRQIWRPFVFLSFSRYVIKENTVF